MKEIPLTQGKVALVDDGDFKSLNSVKWCAVGIGRTFYAKRSKQRNKIIFMHRAILSPPKGMVIDHIDGNGLNNQRSNLRIVDVRENSRNRHHKRSSDFPGVSWDARRKKWQTWIWINGKNIWLGRFNDEISAANAYRNACESLVTPREIAGSVVA